MAGVIEPSPYMHKIGHIVLGIICIKFEAPVLPDDAININSEPSGKLMLPPFLNSKTYLDKKSVSCSRNIYCNFHFHAPPVFAVVW